ALTSVDMAGAALTGRASGTVDFAETSRVDVEYDIERADLGELHGLTNQDASGIVSTRGRVTGPSDALHAAGDASIGQLNAFNVTALTLEGHYDATTASGIGGRTAAQVDGQASF